MVENEAESFREQLSRVEQMALDDGASWDLSVNDTDALKAVLADRQRLAATLNAQAVAPDRLAALVARWREKVQRFRASHDPARGSASTWIEDCVEELERTMRDPDKTYRLDKRARQKARSTTAMDVPPYVREAITEAWQRGQRDALTAIAKMKACRVTGIRDLHEYGCPYCVARAALAAEAPVCDWCEARAGLVSVCAKCLEEQGVRLNQCAEQLQAAPATHADLPAQAAKERVGSGHGVNPTSAPTDIIDG